MPGSNVQTTTTTTLSITYIQIVFWLLLFGEIMSTPCYLFMFYNLLRRKITRNTLQNHAIFILLSFNFIYLLMDLSLTLDFIRIGHKSQCNVIFCHLHAYVDYGIRYGGNFLMLWVTIERHILIFHSILVATARGRLLFHYIPLAICSLYAPILYFYLIVLCPCRRSYNCQKNLCGVVCFRSIVPTWFNWFEILVNYITPILLIVVFSISVIIRTIIRKRRLQRAPNWRRHRKMVVQLILIATLYLVFDLPYVIIMIMQWSGLPNFVISVITPYTTYLTYVPSIILPYATLMTLPDLKQKLRVLIIFNPNRAVIFPLIERT
jgi:hypothetical protein